MFSAGGGEVIVEPDEGERGNEGKYRLYNCYNLTESGSFSPGELGLDLFVGFVFF